MPSTISLVGFPGAAARAIDPGRGDCRCSRDGYDYNVTVVTWAGPIASEMFSDQVGRCQAGGLVHLAVSGITGPRQSSEYAPGSVALFLCQGLQSMPLLAVSA